MNQFEQFFEYYGRVLSVINSSTLTNHLSLVEVHWDYRNASGESVQQTYYHYLLRSTPDGKLKIQVVIARE